MPGLENNTDSDGGVVVMEEKWMSPNHTIDQPGLSVLCAQDIEEDDESEIDSDFFYDDDEDDDLDDLDDDFDDDDDDDDLLDDDDDL